MNTVPNDLIEDFNNVFSNTNDEWMGMQTRAYERGLADSKDEIERLRTEVLDTCNVVKLMIGRRDVVPWHDVPDKAVEGYVAFVRKQRLAAQAAEGGCPKCEVCKGCSHHWLYNTAPQARSTHVCKHCPVVGDECAVCNGDGCHECDGEGVILAAAQAEGGE